MLFRFITIFILIFLYSPVNADVRHKIFENKKSDNLVVFIHGWKGDYLDTWTHRENKKSWPEMLQRDANLAIYDFATIGYDTDCNKEYTVSELAPKLALEIKNLFQKNTYKTLTLVGHSLGGILIREMILSNNISSSLPLENVINFGAPNFGDSLINIIKVRCKGAFSESLSPARGAYLDNLNASWRRQYEQKNSRYSFHYYAGYELLPVAELFKVSKYSALMFSHQTQAFKEDHFSIVKPKSKSSSMYKWVKGILLNKHGNAKYVNITPEHEYKYTQYVDFMKKSLSEKNYKKWLATLKNSKSKIVRPMQLTNKNNFEFNLQMAMYYLAKGMDNRALKKIMNFPLRPKHSKKSYHRDVVKGMVFNGSIIKSNDEVYSAKGLSKEENRRLNLIIENNF